MYCIDSLEFKEKSMQSESLQSSTMETNANANHLAKADDEVQEFLHPRVDWKQTFNETKYADPVCRAIQFLKPELQPQLERALEAFLKTQSLKTQVELRNASLILSGANLKTMETVTQMTEIECQELQKEILMYTKPGDEQYKFAKSFEATDIDKYIKWMNISANQGSVDALNALGDWNFQGLRDSKGVSKIPINYRASFKYFLKSYKQESNSVGTYNLGLCYVFGYGTEQEVQKGLNYLEVAHDSGLSQASFILGTIYEHLHGISTEVEKVDQVFKVVPHDPKKAVHFYQCAAEKHHAGAHNNLGICYEFGLGTKKDVERAFMHYKLASSLGDEFGHCNVGHCYQHGIGIGIDLTAAQNCFKLVKDETISNWKSCRSGLEAPI